MTRAPRMDPRDAGRVSGRLAAVFDIDTARPTDARPWTGWAFTGYHHAPGCRTVHGWTRTDRDGSACPAEVGA